MSDDLAIPFEWTEAHEQTRERDAKDVVRVGMVVSRTMPLSVFNGLFVAGFYPDQIAVLMKCSADTVMKWARRPVSAPSDNITKAYPKLVGILQEMEFQLSQALANEQADEARWRPRLNYMRDQLARSYQQVGQYTSYKSASPEYQNKVYDFREQVRRDYVFVFR